MRRRVFVMKVIAFIIVFVAALFSCVKETSISPATQLKADTLTLGNYLRTNGITATKVLPGAWYTLDTVGLGIFPALSDSIKISYSAWLLPGMTKVDTAKNITFLLSSTIAGMQLTLPSFTVGSYGRLYVPSGLAFGAVAHSTVADYTIPPNSNLLYKIKLVKAFGPKLANDSTQISNYLGSIADLLLNQQISVIYDPTGIRYSIDTVGTGPTPTLQDFVTVRYKGNLLGSDALFTNVTTPTKIALKDQIVAWKIILPKIKEGSSITLYVPSGYGFGSASTTSIPAYSNLVYQIKLLKVN